MNEVFEFYIIGIWEVDSGEEKHLKGKDLCNFRMFYILKSKRCCTRISYNIVTAFNKEAAQFVNGESKTQKSKNIL